VTFGTVEAQSGIVVDVTTLTCEELLTRDDLGVAGFEEWVERCAVP